MKRVWGIFNDNTLLLIITVTLFILIGLASRELETKDFLFPALTSILTIAGIWVQVKPKYRSHLQIRPIFYSPSKYGVYNLAIEVTNIGNKDLYEEDFIIKDIGLLISLPWIIKRVESIDIFWGKFEEINERNRRNRKESGGILSSAEPNREKSGESVGLANYIASKFNLSECGFYSKIQVAPFSLPIGKTFSIGIELTRDDLSREDIYPECYTKESLSIILA